LTEQIERPKEAVLCKCVPLRQRAKIQVERGQVVGRPVGQAPRLGHFEGRLDDTGDADCHLVLQRENVFEETVEAVGPEMRAGRRVDQLRADAHIIAGFAHRAFENIVHPQVAADLLNLECLTFI
jgi:hypothetical protein